MYWFLGEDDDGMDCGVGECYEMVGSVYGVGGVNRSSIWWMCCNKVGMAITIRIGVLVWKLYNMPMGSNIYGYSLECK